MKLFNPAELTTEQIALVRGIAELSGANTLVQQCYLAACSPLGASTAVMHARARGVVCLALSLLCEMALGITIMPPTATIPDA